MSSTDSDHRRDFSNLNSIIIYFYDELELLSEAISGTLDFDYKIYFLIKMYISENMLQTRTAIQLKVIYFNLFYLKIIDEKNTVVFYAEERDE